MPQFMMPPEIASPPPRALHGTGRVFAGKIRFRNRITLLFGFCSLLFLWGMSGQAMLGGKLVGTGVLGILLMSPFLYASQRELAALRLLWRDGVLTSGTFTDKQVRQVNQHAIINAAVEYRDARGLVYEGKLIVQSVVDPTIGETISLLYLPTDPVMAAVFTGADHMEKLTFGPNAKKGVPPAP